MCILIVKPYDKDIPENILENCFKHNKHGSGFAYVNTDDKGVNSIKIRKAMEFDKFLIQYKRATKLAPLSHFIIHFRIRTSGTIEEFNNHPFRISKDMVLGHNGIISPMSGKLDGDENDTRAFIRLILKNLPKDWQYNPAIKAMVEQYIGHSKLATLDNRNRVVMFNESLGNVKDGVWYSNYSWKDRKPVNQYPATTYKDRGEVKPWNKVWLENERIFVDISQATWCTTIRGYIRREVRKPYVSGNTKVYDLRKEREQRVPRHKCDYCDKQEFAIKYSKYVVDSQMMTFCPDCSDLLEKEHVVDARDLRTTHFEQKPF